MADFIIYDQTTGVITGSLSINQGEDAALAQATLAANIPQGSASLAVDPSTPALINHSAWVVQSGALVAVTQTAAQQLSDAQSTKLADLQVAYTNAKAANVSYMSTSFLADPDSQQMFAHALLVYQAVGATPDGFFTVDASYNKVPMTLAQLQGLVEAIAAQVWAVFQHWTAVRESLSAATTVEQVNAVSW